MWYVIGGFFFGALFALTIIVAGIYYESHRHNPHAYINRIVRSLSNAFSSGGVSMLSEPDECSDPDRCLGTNSCRCPK